MTTRPEKEKSAVPSWKHSAGIEVSGEAPSIFRPNFEPYSGVIHKSHFVGLTKRMLYQLASKSQFWRKAARQQVASDFSGTTITRVADS